MREPGTLFLKGFWWTVLNWQTWQTGFLFVFSMQFDGEKPDKMTRGACCGCLYIYML
jgi:hypothetical protein